jgi:hypothetical protein
VREYRIGKYSFEMAFFKEYLIKLIPFMPFDNSRQASTSSTRTELTVYRSSRPVGGLIQRFIKTLPLAIRHPHPHRYYRMVFIQVFVLSKFDYRRQGFPNKKGREMKRHPQLGKPLAWRAILLN